MTERRHSNCFIFAKSWAVLRARVSGMKTINCNEVPLTEDVPAPPDERPMTNWGGSETVDLNKRLAQENKRLTQECAQLAQERNLLRTIVDNLPDFIYAKDRQGRFVFNNSAHVRRLGAKSPQEMRG